MCGIAGILYFDERTPYRQQLKEMTDVMIHRGPNQSGFWVEGKIGLGFRRLSIIDIQEGNQPLSNENESIWIIFNGEIYNYNELRRLLEAKGHRFKTKSDTEVIVHLYEEYGQKCLNYLRGMFSFALWDRNRQLLFAARDHFGIKPFYYYQDKDKFVFASEIKSILAADDIKASLHYQSFLDYLSFQYVPQPDTMFEHIHKLPPAHQLTIQYGKVEIKRYWQPMFNPLDKPITYFENEIRHKLLDSIKYHMHSEVPLGCFLSSGIDSTAIATYMSQLEPTKTFSVGFDGPQNETLIAANTAQELGTQHFYNIITEEKYFDALPNVIWHLDEPVADPSAVALYQVAKLAKDHVKVVLSGEGADELFGGYRIYQEPAALRYISWLPDSIKRALNKQIRSLPFNFYGKNYLLRGTRSLEERFIGNANLLTESMKEYFLHKIPEHIDYSLSTHPITKPIYNQTSHLDDVTRMQLIDMNLWLPGDILAKADKCSMAHSLELRVPFLDKEVFEIASQIPAAYRISNGTTKHVLRRALSGVIPDSVINRPKLGFPVPLRQWLKTERTRVMLEQIQASGIDNIVNMRTIEEIVMKHKHGQGDYARIIWLFYNLALWHKMYVIDLPKSQYLHAAQ
ncbi:asparagine synthase (glutamine-hydrolyzing) [Paenibacillus sp. MMO-58]|uniref:asparagine synthase (glutamine-hydrolyzing) n=1 Tax=Paenibacillus sp. MMO-58 TaxID=3081290 RepID=UPI003019F220